MVELTAGDAIERAREREEMYEWAERIIEELGRRVADNHVGLLAREVVTLGHEYMALAAGLVEETRARASAEESLTIYLDAQFRVEDEGRVVALTAELTDLLSQPSWQRAVKAERRVVALQAQLDALTRFPTPLPKFLNWIADRLVYVHGDAANLDFVQRLRQMAYGYEAAVLAVRDEPAPADGREGVGGVT